MDKGRLEAFSDGVFAIAITLLVLEIRVPEGAGNGLAHALAEQWPSYASYVVSFAVIGIIWVNHHAVFEHVVRADRGLMFLNLFLLLWVVLLPWPTELLATYMREGGSGERTAALVYAGANFMMGLSFGVLWTYVSRNRRLIGPELNDDDIARRTRRFTLGIPVYLVSIVVALFSAPACLAITGALAVYYALPGVGGMPHLGR